MSGKTMLRCGTALTTCLLLVSVSAAQEFGEIADAFRRNLDALRGYSWTSKIEYRIDGALRSTEVYRMHLDSEGKLLGRAQLPVGFTPHDVIEGRMVGVWRDDLDVEYVQVWTIQLPSGGAP